uniref:Saposin B-type domain-containing protein n=1 Tax=Plectus sambesii TaxID=2011161 RepID=A0A914XSY6_9BILA
MQSCTFLLLLSISLLFHGQANASPVAVKTPTSDVGSAKGASCTTCHFLVELLHDLWGDDIVGDCVVELVTYLCTRLDIEDHFICKGIASDFQDEFIYVIGQIVVNPSEICALFIDGCGTPPIDPTKSTWTLPIPDNKPPYVTPKQPAANAPTLKVLHLSDLHIDMQYKPGTEGDCSEPMCCRDPNDPNEKSSKDIKSPAGYWGHIGNCDAPYWLFVSMMQNIAANHKD